MTTLGDLRAELGLTLGDTTTWPNSTVDAYIAAAIRLYSAHYPLRRRTALVLTAGQQAYNLPGGDSLQAVIQVEFPAGARPVRVLTPAGEDSTLFHAGAPVYAVRGPEAAGLGQIVFAETVCAGQGAIVEYLTNHPIPSADNAVLTVPDIHLEAITAYVQAAAHWQLVDAAAAGDGGDTGLLLNQLQDTARAAWLRYREVLDRLVWLGPGYQPPVPLPVWEL